MQSFLYTNKIIMLARLMLYESCMYWGNVSYFVTVGNSMRYIKLNIHLSNKLAHTGIPRLIIACIKNIYLQDRRVDRWLMEHQKKGNGYKIHIIEGRDFVLHVTMNANKLE